MAAPVPVRWVLRGEGQGFYDAVGLEVTIVEGAPDRPTLTTVLSGAADFAVGDADVLLARMRGEPVVVSSGYSEQEVIGRPSLAGLAGFIQKPYRFRDLRTVVERALSSTRAPATM